MPDVTVLFSTHNGAGVLPTVLNAYAMQKPGCTWEMIVVNNASIDSTSACLESFKGKLPLVVLDHPEPGKNKALNAALPKARGSFVIVTDDDAIPEANFLDEWFRALVENPSYDLFGGAIDPFFQKDPPAWMLESQFHFEEIYAVCRHAKGPLAAREIFGPNMAVRSALFESGIRFNEDIGPNGSNRNYPMGSETEFCTRVEGLGHKAFFAPEPRVRHIVRPHQVEKDFWTSRAYRHGLGVGLQERMAAGQLSRPLGKRLASLAKGKLRQAFFYAARNPLHPTDLKYNERLWQYHWCCGYTDAKTRAQL
ncbi:glycosyltransferase family 2 protein [Paracoccus sp. MC1854]|uniref:glycosyltransferase n=1 Tax=Paracoccus sp. MC1854 TaxID=2760306 RepID=UPI002104E634|nr:glycosyltransferase family 2 protein [Paracoccus sp. MC1854]